MNAPVVLLKDGAYGRAVLINPDTNRPATLAKWLVTLDFRSDVKDIPLQHVISLRTEAFVEEDDQATTHHVSVEQLDHRMQGKWFAPIDVADHMVDAYHPPTVRIRFHATDTQARYLARAMAGSCVDGLLYPGSPAADDWGNRRCWYKSAAVTLMHIKAGVHVPELCDG